MRIIVAYAEWIHPLTLANIERFPDVERLDTGGQADGYLRLLTKLWSEKQTFLLIERDQEITEQALREARECDCWWGASTYNGPGLDPIHALGFTRFREELMEAEPDLMSQVAAMNDAIDIVPGHWRRLDARMDGALRRRGYEAHLHSPVPHHHVYYDTNARINRCACLTDHEAYPVDAEGRYRPK